MIPKKENKHKKRIAKEIELLKKIDYVKIIEEKEESNFFIIHLSGPKDSKYKNKVYEMKIEFPEEFPFKSPIIYVNKTIDGKFPLGNEIQVFFFLI